MKNLWYERSLQLNWPHSSLRMKSSLWIKLPISLKRRERERIKETSTPLSYHKIHDIISSSTAFYASATQVHLSNQNKNSWSEVEELSGPERNPYVHIQVSACVRHLITDEVLWGEDSNFTTIHGENWCTLLIIR